MTFKKLPVMDAIEKLALKIEIRNEMTAQYKEMEIEDNDLEYWIMSEFKNRGLD